MLGSWRALYTRIRNLDFILRMINSNWNVSGGWVTDIITFGRFILLYWSLWFVAIIATAHLVLYPFTFPHGPVPHLFFVSLSLLSFIWPLVVCPQELGFYSFLTFCFSGYQTATEFWCFLSPQAKSIHLTVCTVGTLIGWSIKKL